MFVELLPSRMFSVVRTHTVPLTQCPCYIIIVDDVFSRTCVTILSLIAANYSKDMLRGLCSFRSF